jgi:methanogenic corrinoid protein MtbC1
MAVDRAAARRLFMDGVQADGALAYMENVVGVAMDRIGSAWESGGLALSQVYMAGRICEEFSLSVLGEADGERKQKPAVALGVFEDHHVLGKQLVHGVLRNEGFMVRDLGRITLQSTLEALRTGTVEVLLLSCLMLSSALRMRALSAAIRSEGLKVKLIVGGAPFRFDPLLWQEVGADAMGRTASQAPDLIRGVVQGVAGGRA